MYFLCVYYFPLETGVALFRSNVNVLYPKMLCANFLVESSPVVYVEIKKWQRRQHPSINKASLNLRHRWADKKMIKFGTSGIYNTRHLVWRTKISFFLTLLYSVHFSFNQSFLIQEDNIWIWFWIRIFGNT